MLATPWKILFRGSSAAGNETLANNLLTKQRQVSMNITRKRMPATVGKIIPPLIPGEPEKVEIRLDDGEDLFREIRIANTFMDQKGEARSLKPGSRVHVTVEANAEDVTRKAMEPTCIRIPRRKAA
jgi:hypothetical protein